MENLEELKDKMYEYKTKFGENFPSFMKLRTNEENIAIMEKCIGEGKKAEELYPDVYGERIGQQV